MPARNQQITSSRIVHRRACSSGVIAGQGPKRVEPAADCPLGRTGPWFLRACQKASCSIGCKCVGSSDRS